MERNTEKINFPIFDSNMRTSVLFVFIPLPTVIDNNYVMSSSVILSTLFIFNFIFFFVPNQSAEDF